MSPKVPARCFSLKRLFPLIVRVQFVLKLDACPDQPSIGRSLNIIRYLIQLLRFVWLKIKSYLHISFVARIRTTKMLSKDLVDRGQPGQSGKAIMSRMLKSGSHVNLLVTCKWQRTVFDPCADGLVISAWISESCGSGQLVFSAWIRVSQRLEWALHRQRISVQ